MIPHHELAELIDPCCSETLQYYTHSIHPSERFAECKNSSLLLKCTFQCNICNEKKNVHLFEDGSIVIGQPSNQPTAADTPLGKGDFPSREKSVKNASQGCRHAAKIDIQDILKYEHPNKLKQKDQLEQFKKNFPSARPDIFQDVQKKQDTSSRPRCLYNPGKSEFLKPILPKIKEISGCEVKLLRHVASEKSFSNLTMTEKVVTFNLLCRWFHALQSTVRYRISIIDYVGLSVRPTVGHTQVEIRILFPVNHNFWFSNVLNLSIFLYSGAMANAA